MNDVAVYENTETACLICGLPTFVMDAFPLRHEPGLTARFYRCRGCWPNKDFRGWLKQKAQEPDGLGKLTLPWPAYRQVPEYREARW